MNQNNETIPQWKLERFILGELPKKELEALQARVRVDHDLQNRLSELKIQNDKYIANIDLEALANRIHGKHRINISQKFTTKKLNWFSIPVTAIACMAILFIGIFVYTSNKSTLTDDRVKGGGNRIELWQKKEGIVANILNNALLEKGDVIQIRIHPEKKCFGVVVSLDGRGTWTTHLPDSGSTSKAIKPGKDEFLDFAYQLDDAPNYEVFWLVTSDKTFNIDTLMNHFKQLNGSPVPPSSLPLNKSFTQTRISIRK